MDCHSFINNSILRVAVTAFEVASLAYSYVSFAAIVVAWSVGLAASRTRTTRELSRPARGKYLPIARSAIATVLEAGTDVTVANVLRGSVLLACFIFCLVFNTYQINVVSWACQAEAKGERNEEI
jgi:hypothetical protein